VQTLELQRQRTTLVLAAMLVLAAVFLLAWQRRVNRRLHRLSRTDQLTGLLNRRGLIEEMEAPLDAGGRRVVLLVDIDHFKQINDRHGHAAGDRVLSAVARAIETSAQAHGARAARWGGEEFAVLAGAADGAAALRLAGEIGGAAGAVSVAADDGTPITVAVSIGFAPVFADGADRPGWQHTLRVADGLLYQAKRDGRGRSAGAWPVAPGAAAPAPVDAVDAAPGWRLLAARHVAVTSTT
jgi:diguanylate cyclase (GGDEF)-like protein